MDTVDERLCCGLAARTHRPDLNLDHFKVFLTHAALGAEKICRDIAPACSRSNVLFNTSLGFVVDPAADYALPLSHEQFVMVRTVNVNRAHDSNNMLGFQ